MDVDHNTEEHQQDGAMDEALPPTPTPHKTVPGTDLFGTPVQTKDIQGATNSTTVGQEGTNTSPNSQGNQDNAEDSTKSVAENLGPKMDAAQKDKSKKKNGKGNKKRVSMAQDNPFAYPSQKEIT